MTHASPTLEQFVELARGLYSLPAVAIQVLDLTNHPQVDLRALKECIENDPAITIKVLRVVNSSFYGLSREVSDLGQALALLGIKPLKLLVLGFSLSDAVFSRSTGTTMLRCWRHTLTKAVAAREIAETVCRVPGDEAFIAALLQDIGMLVLLQELGEPYARLLGRPFATQHDLAERETESLGFDHTELTARLLEGWGLPESLQRAVAVSHAAPAATETSPASAIARILHLAHLLADLLVDARHDVLAGLLDTRATGCRLTQTQLSVLVGNLQSKVAQLADVFSLEFPPGLDYRDVLLQAHERMAQVSAELASELVQTDRAQSTTICDAAATLDEVQALSSAVSRFIGRPAETIRAKASGVLKGSVGGACDRGTTDRPSASQRPLTKMPVKNEQSAVARGVKGHASAARLPPCDEDGGVMHRLDVAIDACRESHLALSLALVEIDHFPQMVLDQGPQYSAGIARLVHEMCRQLDAPQISCVPIRPYAFALLLPECDRQQAAQLCHQMLNDARRQLAAVKSDGHSLVSFSVGLASVDVPTKNFSSDTLYESAARCLSVAQLSGGNTLKSIGVY